MVTNRFGELLAEKQRVEKRSISLDKAAEESGVAKITLIAYKKNRVTRYDSSIINRLCRYFNCGIADLLVLEDEKTTVNAPA